MKLRTKYLLFVFFLHAVALVLSFLVFKSDKVFFLVAELVILLSLWLSWGFYKELIRPLKLLMTGVEAIKDRDFNVKFRPTGKYEMDRLIQVYNEMIDQIRGERTRQEQQHFFLEKLIATAPTGIMILDFDNYIEALNPRAETLLHLEEKEVRGKLVTALEHPLLQQVASLQVGEARTISVNGTNTYRLQVAQFIDRGFSRQFVTIEELTAEILAAEKKVYEKVIRMMAHEVNNTVGPVNSILQSTLEAKATRVEPSPRITQALQVAIDRNNNLNQFMRNFADLVKLPPPARTKVDLHRVIRNVCELMAIQAEQRAVRLEVAVEQAPFFVGVDVQQFEQALLNIVKNAFEAIGTGGTISFETDPERSVLRIVDTGKGITEEEARHLFSPFFSTKKDGQGIGLVLVRDILINHGFLFSLKTIKPQQTVFCIRF